MGSVKDYFSSLGAGLASLVKGMQITGKEFITPKITEKYPEHRDTVKVPSVSVRFWNSNMMRKEITNVSHVEYVSVIVLMAQLASQVKWWKLGTERKNASWTNMSMTWVAVLSVSCV